MITAFTQDELNEALRSQARDTIIHLVRSTLSCSLKEAARRADLALALNESDSTTDVAIEPEPEPLKSGDRFMNTSGGWGGKVLIVEGDLATVRYDGENLYETKQVNLDTIKRDGY